MSRGWEKLRRDLLYDDPVDCGICTLTKERKALDEARTVSEVHRSPISFAAYGLFAGHGGATASELCARNFVPNLLEDATLKYDPERALRNSCDAIEAFVLAKSALDRAYYGTTVLFTLIVGQQMYVLNIGNSRAVVATRDGAQTITQEHDGSNAEEVARVRNAGGFFQDGKVNNLIRVTRAIGDLELKDRKHLTFPNRRMTEDIVIATPDIFCRKITSRDYFLVMATAEVWEHLSTKAVIHLVTDALRKGENSRSCAKKVASAALASGARGPLTVMLLIFGNAKALQDKGANHPSRKRTSRPSSLKRHSSNAEQELRTLSNKAKVKAATPAFVRQAQAQEENKLAMRQHAIPHSSPVTSPAGPPLKSSSSIGSRDQSPGMAGITSGPFLSLDVRPSANTAHAEMSKPERPEAPRATPGIRSKQRTKLARAHSMLGFSRGGTSQSADPDEERPSRQQIDIQRRETIAAAEIVDGQVFDDRQVTNAAPTKPVVVSRMSELTASGKTGGADSLEASFTDMSPAGDFGDLVDYGPSGPAKVRYREDGTVHTSRLAFLKEIGRTFTRRR